MRPLLARALAAMIFTLALAFAAGFAWLLPTV